MPVARHIKFFELNRLLVELYQLAEVID